MRKKVSFLLSLVMILSMLPANVLHAVVRNNSDELIITNKKIKPTKGGFITEDLGLGAEEATIEWDISDVGSGGNGYYELVYYSEQVAANSNNMSRIRLGFDVGTKEDGKPSSDTIALTWAVDKYVGSDTYKTLDEPHTRYLFPYEGEEERKTTPEFKAELKYSVQGNGKDNTGNLLTKRETEMNVKLSNSINVRAFVDQVKQNNRPDKLVLKVYVDGLKKGYFTDFVLTHKSNKANQNVIETKKGMVFPGVANAQIIPVHLIKSDSNNITTTGALTSKKVIGKDDDELAGSKPGVKFEFEKPKTRDKNEFKYVDEKNGGSDVDATVTLTSKFEKDKNISVEFNLGTLMVEGQKKKLSLEKTKNDVNPVKEVQKLALYFSKTSPFDSSDRRNEHIIEWNSLEESMLLDGVIVYTGSMKGNKLTGGNYSLGTGYTYLKYMLEQTADGGNLSITPYKYNGKVAYTVYLLLAEDRNEDDITNSNNEYITRYFAYDPTKPNDKLEIPIPFGASIVSVQIKVAVSEKTDIHSQKLIYKKDPNAVLSPPTPYIKEVSDIRVLNDRVEDKAYDENEEEEEDTNVGKVEKAIRFNIIWDNILGTGDELKKYIGEHGKLYFELNIRDSNKENRELIAVFEFDKDPKTGKIEGRQVVNTPAAEVDYDEQNNLFIANEVILKDTDKDGGAINLNNFDYDNANDIDYLKSIQDGYTYKKTYEIPGSYYLTMRAIFAPKPGEKLKVNANESELFHITLDETKKVLSAPSVFSHKKNEKNTNISLNFENVSIKEFENYMLRPGKWGIIGATKDQLLPRTYEVFLYQESYLDSNNQKKKNDISDGELKSYMKENNNDKILKILKPLTTTSSQLDVLENEDIINALREGKVIKFDYDYSEDGKEYIPIEIIGLDSNQSYYVRVRTVVKSERDGKEREPHKSLFSKIYGFTTTTESKPIRPDEETPPIPKNFKAEAKDNSTAVLTWQDPDIKIEEGDGLKYEIIRVTSQKIDEQLLSKRDITASEIIGAEASKKATLLEDYKLVNVDGKVFYELIDPTLQPNTVYYYYIRTVYNGAYSEWIYQPVTTSNIEKPISLKAYNATKSTVDISFLAKVPYDLIPGTYDFTIAIQGEGDAGWTTVSSSNLSRLNNVSSPQTEEGYYFYEYRISGLKAGKRYNIKVAVVDKTKEMIDGKYQQSLYSDIASIRTEYDEEEQIQDDKFKEYLDKFDKEAEKLKNKAYWVVEAGSVYKYRANYINSDMALSKQYQLVSEGNTNSVSYYLPASVVEQMNNVGVTLEIVLGEQSVNIRPQTILSTTEEIKEAILLKQERTLADYYVVINVSKSNYTGNINGEEVISPKINVEMDVAYLRQEDILMEADILEALDKIIQDKRKDFITDLERKIKNGVIADDVLQDIIDRYMEDIKKEHVRDVSKIMKNQVKKEISIEQIAKSMLITHKSSHTSINAYYYKKGWIQVETYSSGDSAYIEALYLGTYTFTGGKDLIESVPTLAPYQNFINQYKLDEFFTLDSYMIKTAASKGQVYGALARVMGAPAGSDYMTYLTSKGIKGVSRLGSNNYIRQDEAIYLVMQGYEMLHHRKVETIVIKNKQSLTNIGAFQPIYRPYVYAAVELKIIDNPNSKALPSKQMSAEEMIKMLYRIQV